MSILKTFLAGLFATLLTDEEKLLQQPLDNYTTSLVSDPSITNATAQSLNFQSAIMAIGPQAGSIGIKDTAMALKALIDVQLPSLTASIAAQAQAAAAAAPATPPVAVTPVVTA